MRLFVNIVLIAGLSYYGEMYFPWWIIVVIAAVVCAVVHVGLLQAFISGFLGIGLLWFGLAWKIHTDSEGVLSAKVTALFGLSDPLQLIVLTGLIGGLLAGLAAMSGSASHSVYRRRKRYRGPYL